MEAKAATRRIEQKNKVLIFNLIFFVLFLKLLVFMIYGFLSLVCQYLILNFRTSKGVSNYDIFLENNKFFEIR